jgi:type IX secretion system PorP/SprF family membrane protein
MKKCIIGLCLFVAAETVRAQSYHFSQFFSTPLLTNPANTGSMDGGYRFASNIRSQGLSGGNPYFTGYVSAEVNPLRNSLPEGHKAGIGLYIMNDHSLGGAVQTNSVGLSAAYHVGLDPYGENSFGVGVQAAYHQRRYDYSKLSFENQFGPGGFDGSLPVGEPLNADSRSFFDVNAGLLYNRTVGANAYFGGLSVYNILQHKENVLNEEFSMPTRLVLQGGSQFSFGPGGNLYVSLTAMYQANASEITAGAAYGIPLTEEERNELLGGLWYRINDAAIPYIGFRRNDLQVGLSYDYTVSALKAGAQVRNAFELTFVFRGAINRELKTTVPWY